jgi:hypothetical protein
MLTREEKQQVLSALRYLRAFPEAIKSRQSADAALALLDRELAEPERQSAWTLTPEQWGFVEKILDGQTVEPNEDLVAAFKQHHQLGAEPEQPLADVKPFTPHEKRTWLLRQVIDSLPQKRDWLDPALEAEIRATLAEPERLEWRVVPVFPSGRTGTPWPVDSRAEAEKEVMRVALKGWDWTVQPECRTPAGEWRKVGM